MTTSAIAVAGLERGHVTLTPQQLDDLARGSTVRCCDPLTVVGPTRS
jgi:hypothetical protein